MAVVMATARATPERPLRSSPAAEHERRRAPAVSRRHSARLARRSDGVEEEGASSESGTSDDEAAGEGDAPLDEPTAAQLLKQAKVQVASYARGTDEADLVLTAELTSEQRKELHSHIDKFELQHMSVGVGTSRRLVVSRFKPFAAVTAAQAKEVVGSLA